MIKALKFLPAALFLFSACNPEKVDTSGVKEEMENFKIKKITQGEIMAKADTTGTDIFEKFQVNIQNTRLDSALKNGSFENAMLLCNYHVHPEKELLEKKHQAEIYRIGLPGKSGGSSPDSVQKLILDAYQYNQEKGLGYFNDVQILENEIIYSHPIVLDQQSCLRCHGNPKTEIGSENYSKLIARFPDYQYIHFKKGDLVGIFSLKMDKAELIRRIK